jgi:polysaccharide pyruvyl transferase WcaK-like protein
MNKLILILLVGILSPTAFAQNNLQHDQKKKILLRSSWQTINIGDIAHSPGVIALCEKYIPDVEVILWASQVGDGVREMLHRRFPKLQIILTSDTLALKKAFKECDFLLHGSGPYLVANEDVDRWIKETGKPFGVYGITLPAKQINEKNIKLLNQASFIYFRDGVSLELAKKKGIKSPIMEFGPDGAFATDLRNDDAAIQFMKENGLEADKFLCVIPKNRNTPKWKVPGSNIPFNKEINDRNEAMKEHDCKPYRDAIIALVTQTDMKVLICPEDVTQVALGKEMLYDPLPEAVKQKVVWRNRYWLTDEAMSVFVRSAGYFGLEQHTPIMFIGNGIPALLGRFEEQTSKGFMWQDIGLNDWLFDSDDDVKIAKLSSTVLSLVQNSKAAKMKAQKAKRFVEKLQAKTMKQLRKSLNLH